MFLEPTSKPGCVIGFLRGFLWGLFCVQVYAQEPVSEVISSVDSDSTVVVSQSKEKKWGLNDEVCVTQKDKGVRCGKVILATPDTATVKLNADLIPIDAKKGGVVKAARITKLKKGDKVISKKEVPTDSYVTVDSEMKKPITINVTINTPPPAPVASTPAPNSVVQSPFKDVRTPTSKEPSDASLEKIKKVRKKVSRWYASIGSGVIRTDYVEDLSDSETIDYAVLSLALFLSAGYEFDSQFSLGLNVSADAVPISMSSATEARFLTVDGGADLSTDGDTVFGVQIGGRYRTSFVTNSEFGYKQLTSPLIAPYINFPMIAGGRVTATLKALPCFNGLSFLPLGANREIEFDATWRSRETKAFFVSLGYSNLKTDPGIVNNRIQLSGGYQW